METIVYLKRKRKLIGKLGGVVFFFFVFFLVHSLVSLFKQVSAALMQKATSKVSAVRQLLQHNINTSL